MVSNKIHDNSNLPNIDNKFKGILLKFPFDFCHSITGQTGGLEISDGQCELARCIRTESSINFFKLLLLEGNWVMSEFFFNEFLLME